MSAILGISAFYHDSAAALVVDGDIAAAFFTEVLTAIKGDGLLSDEHFTVDGTLLEAWASHKSFKPKGRDRTPPDDPKNPTVNFHGQTRRNDTHQSMTDPEARERFVAPARMIASIRRALDDDAFVEVETPVLQPRYGGAFARPFSTHHNELDQTLYLRIATELYLKRLIVGGLERVYEIGKDFRNEGVSYKHNPEFTMLEWYEAYADYRDTMLRMEKLVTRVAEETLGTTQVTFRGHQIDLARWQRVRLVDALEGHGLWTRDEAELLIAALALLEVVVRQGWLPNHLVPAPSEILDTLARLGVTRVARHVGASTLRVAAGAAR